MPLAVVRINLPNQITLGRLVLALAFFGLLSVYQAGPAGEGAAAGRALLVAAFWIFLLAALGDALDGYLARAMQQVTTFGRIIDPVVDKVMVCGAFVFFASPHFFDGVRNISDVAPWMVIVMLLRELLVTGIRSHAEASGEPFAAVWVGKLKMIVQSTAVCVILGTLGWNLTGLAWLREALLWLAIGITAVSAAVYVRRAQRFLLSSAALSGQAPEAEGGVNSANLTASMDVPGRRPETPATQRPRSPTPLPRSRGSGAPA